MPFWCALSRRRSLVKISSNQVDFEELSGLEINTTKTEAMWLGEWKDRTDEPFGFKWPKEPVNALGVFFSHNQESANRLNFGEKIRNLEKTLITWQRRNLTLYGKIKIVKTLGISKLIYSASVLPVPDHYIQEINKLTFNFLWAGKPPKIKRNTIIGEKKDGGLKMCDFNIMEKALKIAWVNRIQDDSQASWKIIPNQLLLSLKWPTAQPTPSELRILRTCGQFL